MIIATMIRVNKTATTKAITKCNPSDCSSVLVVVTNCGIVGGRVGVFVAVFNIVGEYDNGSD